MSEHTVMREAADSDAGCPPGWHGPWRSTDDGWVCVDCGEPETRDTPPAKGDAR